MSKELIERLRIFGSEPDTGNTYHEAADLIEQLQKSFDAQCKSADRLFDELAAAQAKVAELESALMNSGLIIESLQAREAKLRDELKLPLAMLCGFMFRELEGEVPALWVEFASKAADGDEEGPQVEESITRAIEALAQTEVK